MLFVFSPIFVAEAKIIFGYDFVAPLKSPFHIRNVKDQTNKAEKKLRKVRKLARGEEIKQVI